MRHLPLALLALWASTLLTGCAFERGGLADASNPNEDASVFDSGTEDASVPDAGAEDASTPDGGSCTEGADRCSGTMVQTCSGGAWVDSMDCSATGCSEAGGAHCLICVDGMTRSCSMGTCSGTETCAGGDWGSCSASGSPETCDGTDQDCDGNIDEDATGGICDCRRAVIGGSTYRVCEGDATWDAGRAACVAAGYDLAKVESASENDMLWAVAEMGSTTRYWIGLNDTAMEGTWVWTDGSALGGYNDWHPGGGSLSAQPNGGNCVVMHRDVGGNWADRPCDGSSGYGYICEVTP